MYLTKDSSVYKFTKEELKDLGNIDTSTGNIMIQDHKGELVPAKGLIPYYEINYGSAIISESELKLTEKEIDVIRKNVENFNKQKKTDIDINKVDSIKQVKDILAFLNDKDNITDNAVRAELQERIITNIAKLYANSFNVKYIQKLDLGNSLTIFENTIVTRFRKSDLERINKILSNADSVIQEVYYVPSECLHTFANFDVTGCYEDAETDNKISVTRRERIFMTADINYIDNISNTTETQKEQKPMSPNDVSEEESEIEDLLAEATGVYLNQSEVYGMSVEATLSEMEKALDWFNKSPLKTELGLDITHALVYGDRKQFATLHDAVITLYKGSNNTTLYHEAFHVITQYCMTQEQRDKLYNELRSVDGYFKEYKKGKSVKFSRATDLQLEEYLAESFRHFMLTGKTVLNNDLRTTERSLFDKILDLVDKIFKKLKSYLKWHKNTFSDVNVNDYSTATPIINELFKNLKNGTVSDYVAKFNLKNAEFETLDQSLFYADQDILRKINVYELSIDGLKNIVKIMSKEDIEDLKTIDDIDEDLMKQVKFEENNGQYSIDNNSLNILRRSRQFYDLVEDFILINNITQNTEDFEHEATYVNIYSSFTIENKGKYGIDENMSSMVMQYMKKAYIVYVMDRIKEMRKSDDANVRDNVRGLMYYIEHNTFLKDFKESGLSEQLKKRGNGKTKQEYNIIQFIEANLEYFRTNDNQLGIWSPFISYIKNELQNVIDTDEEIMDNEDDGEQAYNMQNEIKQKDNQKSLIEHMRGEVRFLLGSLSYGEDLENGEISLSTKPMSKLSFVTNAIFSYVTNKADYKEFYEAMSKYSNEVYIKQLIDMIGYPPDETLYEKQNKTKEDDDRIDIWHQLFMSYNVVLRETLREDVHVSEVDIKDKKNEKDNDEYWDDYEENDINEDYENDPYSGWDDTGLTFEDETNVGNNGPTKEYQIIYSLSNGDQFATEIEDYIRKSFDSHPEQTNVNNTFTIDNHVIGFRFGKNGIKSYLAVYNLSGIDTKGFNSSFGAIISKLPNEISNEKFLDFLKFIGIELKDTPFFQQYFSNNRKREIVASIISNMYEKSNGASEVRFYNTKDFVYGGILSELSKVLATQINCSSSFSSMNGEKNMNNRHALNSYFSQIVKILGSLDFRNDFQDYLNGNMTKTDFLDKYEDIKPFLTSPYFEVARSKNNGLFKYLLNPNYELVVAQRNGTSIFSGDKYKAGNTNFNCPDKLKRIIDLYLANSIHAFTPIQWADKEPGLSLILKTLGGKYLNMFEGISKENVYDTLVGYMSAEIKRIMVVKYYKEHPWIKFSGDRNYLNNADKVSYFDEIFGGVNFEEKDKKQDAVNEFVNEVIREVTKVIKDNTGEDVTPQNIKLNDILTILNNSFKSKLESNLNKYFTNLVNDFTNKVSLKNYKIKIGGKLISQSDRELVNEKGPNIEKFVIGSWISHLNHCILLTNDHNNYDSYSKRNGTAISTGRTYENDKYFNDLIDRRNRSVNEEKKSYSDTVDGFNKDSDYLKVRDQLNVVTIDDIITSSKFSEEVRKLKLIDDGTYEKMETANAMGYVSFDTYRTCMQRIKRWTDEQEALYLAIVNGRQITEKDVMLHFPPLKLQYYADMADGTIQQKVLLKNQYLPLVPTAIEGKGLQKLHEIMVRDGIDFVTTKNGSKCCDKTDHQGELTSVYKFGLAYNPDSKKYEWNEGLLPESLRYVSIHADIEDGKVTDIYKDNGNSAIEEVNGHEVIFTENIVDSNNIQENDEIDDNSVEVYNVIRENDSIRLERSYFNTNGELKQLRNVDAITINNESGEIKIMDNNVHISDNCFKVTARFYRDQLEIHNTAGNKISVYTQFTSMASMNIFVDGKPKDYTGKTDWNELSEDEKKEQSEYYSVLSEFEEAFGAVCDNVKNKVFNRIGTYDKETHTWSYNKEAILNIIKKEADNSKDIPQSVYQDININNIGDYLNNSNYSSQLTQLVIGRLTKDIVKIKLYGDNMKQSPDLLFDSLDDVSRLNDDLKKTTDDARRKEIRAEIDSKFKNVGLSTFNNLTKQVKEISAKDESKRTDEEKQILQQYSDIETTGKDTRKRLYSNAMVHSSDTETSGFYHLDENGVMQACKIKITFCDEFKFLAYNQKVVERASEMKIQIVDSENKDTIYMSNLCKVVNSLLADNSFDENEMKMFQCIGVRIPTQGYNFMDFMQISEFIDPALGPTIILPKEMVEKNGSDYDIDSMPIMFPHIAKVHNYDAENKTDTITTEFVDEYTLEKIGKRIGYLKNKTEISVDPTQKAFGELFDKVFDLSKDKSISNDDIDNLKKLPFMTNAEIKDFIFKNNLLLQKVFLISQAKHRKRTKDVEAMEYLELYRNSIMSLISKKASADYVDTKDKNDNYFKESFDNIKEFIEKKSEQISEEQQRMLDELREQQKLYRKCKDDVVFNRFLRASYKLIGCKANYDSLLRKSDTHLFTNDGSAEEYGIYKEYGFNETCKQFGIDLNDSIDEKQLSSSDKLSSEFNEFVRSSNNVSMKALGIAAVGTKWAVNFCRMGALMSETFVANKNTYNTTLMLAHNEVDGRISLGSNELVDGYSKFEIFNELVSGFVDGAKDPWPASLHFNVETTPIVCFLFWAGCARNDVITLMNYSNIKSYISKYREFVSGIGRYAEYSYGSEKMKKNGFLKKHMTEFFGKEFAEAYEKYVEETGEKIPVLEFAYKVLNNISANVKLDDKSGNMQRFISSMIISNGKEEKLNGTKLASYKGSNGILQKKTGEDKYEDYNVEISYKTKDDKGVEITKSLSIPATCKLFAMTQYLMAEKMSGDVTNFTTTFESDKNEYKTLAEVNKYKSLIDPEKQDGTFNYAENFGRYDDKLGKYVGKFQNTNLGRRFFNEEFYNLMKGFFDDASGVVLKNDKEVISMNWRNDEKLNELLEERLRYVQNGQDLYENIESAKDKLANYFFQNELASDMLNSNYEIVTYENNPKLYEISAKNNGIIKMFDENGMYKYIINNDYIQGQFASNRDSFASIKEFLNYVIVRDKIYNMYKNKAKEVTLVDSHDELVGTETVTKYSNFETKMKGNILYDAIQNAVISNYNSKNTGTYIDANQLKILANITFETYCSTLAMFKTYNYNALMLGTFDKYVSFANIFCAIINENPEITETFPILKNLFTVKENAKNEKDYNYDRKSVKQLEQTQSLKFTKIIDTNRSNAQYGDETEQIRDVLYGSNGLMNKGVLMKMFEKSTPNYNELTNKVDSIVTIISMLPVFCMIQAGTNITGKFGIAKLGDDSFRASIIRDKLINLIHGLHNENDSTSRDMINKILAFESPYDYGVTLPTGETNENEDKSEAFRLLSYSGASLVDETYNGESLVGGVNEMNKITFNNKDYYYTKTGETFFILKDSKHNNVSDEDTYKIVEALIKNDIDFDHPKVESSQLPMGVRYIYSRNPNDENRFTIVSLINNHIHSFEIIRKSTSEKGIDIKTVDVINSTDVYSGFMNQTEKFLSEKLGVNEVMLSLLSSKNKIPMPKDFLTERQIPTGIALLMQMYGQYFSNEMTGITPVDIMFSKYSESDVKDMFNNPKSIVTSNDDQYQNNVDYFTRFNKAKEIINNDNLTFEQKQKEIKNLYNQEVAALNANNVNVLNYRSNSKLCRILWFATDYQSVSYNTTIFNTGIENVIKYINTLPDVTSDTKRIMEGLLREDINVINEVTNTKYGRIYANTEKNDEVIDVIIGSNGNGVPVVYHKQSLYAHLTSIKDGIMTDEYIKFDMPSNRFISAFRDQGKFKTQNGIILNEISNSQSGIVAGMFSDNVSINVYTDDKGNRLCKLILTMNGKKYSIDSENKKDNAETQINPDVTPFFMNIYSTPKINSRNIKRSDFVTVGTLQGLLSTVQNTKSKILISDDLVKEITKEENQQMYFDLLCNMCGVQTNKVENNDRTINEVENKCK